MHSPLPPMSRSTVAFAKSYRAAHPRAARRSRPSVLARVAGRVRRLYDALPRRARRTRTRPERPPRATSASL